MTPAEIAGVLEISGRAYADLLRSLPAEVASWQPAPGEWCVSACLGHVIETERRSFAGRIRIILADAEPALETWDQGAAAESRNDCARKPADLVAEFEPVRRDSVTLVRSLRPDALQRGGIHPEVGRLTVAELLHEWVHHDGNHLRQAYANVQAYAWRSMGNAQRFTTG